VNCSPEGDLGATPTFKLSRVRIAKRLRKREPHLGEGKLRVFDRRFDSAFWEARAGFERDKGEAIMEQKLNGRRIAALAADGFEKVELTIPIYALRFAGATVDVVSLRHGRIRGVNLHEPAGRVRVDKTVEEADPRRMTLCCSRADLSIPICCGNHSARANLCAHSTARASRSRVFVMDRGCSHRRVFCKGVH
jgi:hypothetical protein